MAREPEAIPEPDRAPGAPHPRETLTLYGQHAAETAFLAAWRAGRLHHAWLLRGARGVGKATLAYRIARALLAQDAAPQTLALAGDHPVARRVAAQSEARLKTLRRPWDAKAKRLRAMITVDEVRGLRPFFGLSAADGGWRVAVVDAADEMNPAAANALLKMLEEPPERAMLLLVAQAPGGCCPPSARAAERSTSRRWRRTIWRARWPMRARARRPTQARWRRCRAARRARRCGWPIRTRPRSTPGWRGCWRRRRGWIAAR